MLSSTVRMRLEWGPAAVSRSTEPKTDLTDQPGFNMLTRGDGFRPGGGSRTAEKGGHVVLSQSARDIRSRQVRSRHVTSHHITSRHVTSRHVTSRHVTSRHVNQFNSKLTCQELPLLPAGAFSCQSVVRQWVPRSRSSKYSVGECTSDQSARPLSQHRAWQVGHTQQHTASEMRTCIAIKAHQSKHEARPVTDQGTLHHR